jgi:hypothetical protein
VKNVCDNRWHFCKRDRSFGKNQFSSSNRDNIPEDVAFQAALQKRFAFTDAKRHRRCPRFSLFFLLNIQLLAASTRRRSFLLVYDAAEYREWMPFFAISYS